MVASPSVRAETLYAGVVLNGRDLGVVVPFQQGASGLEMTPQDFTRLGLRLPPEAIDAEGMVVLSAVRGLRYTMRGEDQAVEITADPDLMVTQIINPEPRVILPDPVAWGGLVNYAVSVTAPARGSMGYAATVEGRAFGPPGVFSTTWLFQDYGGPGRYDDGLRRLDTTFIHDDPARMRQFVLGDYVSGFQSWSRPVRGAGVSLRSDFGLRPEMITQPLPMLRGAPSVPSTVDLYIDGVKQLSQPTRGPFQIQQPPVLNGYGQLSMVVTDALGRQSVQSFAFYGSNALLRPGLMAYALDAGWLRADYAGPRDRYTDPFAQATARLGISDGLTVEGRLAATKSLGQAGAGVVFKVAEVAVVSLAGDLTHGDAGTGGLWQATVEHRTGPFSIYGSISKTFGDFRDLAAQAGDPLVNLRIIGGASLSLRELGNFNANYTRVRTDRTDAGIVTMSYNRSIGPRATLNISGYLSQFGLKSKGISAGILIPFGRRGTAGVQAGTGSHSQSYASAYVNQPAPLDGGLGWRLRAEGRGHDMSEVEGEVRLDSNVIDAALALEASQWGLSARGFATGSIVWLAGSSPRISSAVGQSFAIVQTSAPGIAISQENRVIGRTGRDGSLFVPYVPSFSPSRIEIVPGALPFSLQAPQTQAVVRPPRKAGVMVSLPVEPNRSIYLRLVGPSGKPPAVGSGVLVDGRQVAVVGYEGLVWIEDAAGITAITVADPDGHCTAVIPPSAPTGDAEAKEVPCHAS